MGKKIYTTQQIAKYVGVSVGTVRNYEARGLISKTERADNGYRKFKDFHKLQMAICVLIFKPPYINKLIRKAALEIIHASVKKNFSLCKELTEKYIGVIESELVKANEAVKALEYFQKPKVTNISYSRKEASVIIGTTAEAIRNWERNNLIKSIKKGKKRVYNQNEIEIMRLIYALLSSGITIKKIYESIIFLRRTDNQKAVSAVVSYSDDDTYIRNINKNNIDRLNEVLDSAHKIMELL